MDSNSSAYTVQIDSINIPLNSDFRVTTYFTYTTYETPKADYLVAYNAAVSSIDIINLSKRVFVKHLPLLKSGFLFDKLDTHDIDKSRSITDIHVINFDSILINNSNRTLFLIDSSLKRKQNIALDSISLKNGISGRLISYSNNFRMLFYNGGLLLNQVYPTYDWQKQTPVFSLVNLSTEKMKLLPIAYSDYLHKIKGNAGFLASIVTSEYQREGVLTYSYLYESNIYQYNDSASTITSYGGKSSKGKNLVDSIMFDNDQDLKKWDIHNIENTQFFNVMYDKYRHVYYRFSLRNISYENGKYFNSILEKPLVLMIFNEKFEVIKELEFPLYRYAPNTWFVTREGLFISPTNKKNKFIDPDHLRYHIIKINKKI